MAGWADLASGTSNAFTESGGVMTDLGTLDGAADDNDHSASYQASTSSAFGHKHSVHFLADMTRLGLAAADSR